MNWISAKIYKQIRESVPMLAVDCVLEQEGKFLLIRRATKPFEGYWALPGGHVRFGERVEDAVLKICREETGLEVEIERLVGVYSDPGRDPWGHVITICYVVRSVGGELAPFSAESSNTKFFDFNAISKIGSMAFDHRQLLLDAITAKRENRPPIFISAVRSKMAPARKSHIPSKLYNLIIKSVPLAAVDGVLRNGNKLLMIKRSVEPCKGDWALPGGHVHFGETLVDAIVREFKEETGVDVEVERLIGVYSDPTRNTVGHIVSFCFEVRTDSSTICNSSEEVDKVEFLAELPGNIAFDHAKMIGDAKRV